MPPFTSSPFRTVPHWAAAVILVLMGCRGPELRVASRADLGHPIFLVIHLPGGPDRESREKTLRENLVVALGARHSFVAFEDRKDRDPILQIDVDELSRGGAFSKTVSESISLGASKGTEAGLATGAEAVSNSKPQTLNEVKESLVFCVFTTVAGAAIGATAGTVAGVTEGVTRSAYQDFRLGYRPKHLVCRLSYAPSSSAPLREVGATDAWAVVKEMHPMSNKDAHDIQKLHKEEARALAVVIERLLSRVDSR